MRKESETPYTTYKPDLLGIGDLDSAVTESYDSRRRETAINIASELSAKSEEFSRRQSELNGEFVEQIASGFPHFVFGYKAEMYKPKSINKLHGLDVKGLFARISYNSANRDISDVNGEFLSRLSSLRAVAIWVKSSRGDQIDFSISGGSAAGQFSQISIPEEVILPYVLIGHRQKEGHHTEVLLMPLFPFVKDDPFEHTPKNPVLADISAERSNVYPDRAVLRWKNNLIQATMPTDQYESLVSLQESLFDMGFEAEEITAIHDNENGVFSISDDLTVGVRGHVQTGLHLSIGHKYPEAITDLENHDFALTHAQFRDTDIEPVEFLEFDVLKDTQRTAAMLGLSEVFEEAKEKLEKRSLEDPNGNWFDHAIS